MGKLEPPLSWTSSKGKFITREHGQNCSKRRASVTLTPSIAATSIAIGVEINHLEKF